MPPEKNPDTGKTVDPTQKEGEDAGQPPTQPIVPVTKLVTPDSTEEVKPQPTAMPPTPGADTTSPSPATTRVAAPPRFLQWPVAPSPSLAPPVPSGIILDKADLQAQVADRSMAYLTQSLAMTQAGGNPHAGSFSGVMTRLRKACRLMTEGFWQACLDVEVVVQKTIEEATAHDWAFTAKAAKDLDLWTLALQLLFDTDEVSEANMETRRAHAQHTRQVVSDWILSRSREVAQIQHQDGGPV